jgi:hypothetical protein
MMGRIQSRVKRVAVMSVTCLLAEFLSNDLSPSTSAAVTNTEPDLNLWLSSIRKNMFGIYLFKDNTVRYNYYSLAFMLSNFSLRS